MSSLLMINIVLVRKYTDIVFIDDKHFAHQKIYHLYFTVMDMSELKQRWPVGMQLCSTMHAIVKIPWNYYKYHDCEAPLELLQVL